MKLLSQTLVCRRLLIPNSRCKSTSAITDLASFLKTSQGKDQTTSTFRGTLFEWQTCEALQKGMGMQLRRTGGRSDRGVDLYGEWPIETIINHGIKGQERTLSSSSSTPPCVIVQCKNIKSGCTPDHIRSLVGAVVLANDSTRDTIGILAGVRPFTREVTEHFMGSNVPLGLARIKNTSVQSLLFNAAAEDVLQGLVVVTEYNADGITQEPVLMYDGMTIKLNESLRCSPSSSSNVVS
ncbi:predicted protein [Lichtheimia corymbifera JMRC:FSU:9682]|uniref:Restriction endonuclease type IV Mrr domain-containing protein n=1 Tax=Lichtheimia corymbifera JMRC:FSU:9682 TaxID=1263082 RepID=A0A068S8Z8_9FUNG|nr:predicted protein [Lichtheimia corymbifera JMRC:FSU:9682]